MASAKEPVVGLAGFQLVREVGKEAFRYKLFDAEQPGLTALLTIDSGGRLITSVDDQMTTLKIGRVPAKAAFRGGAKGYTDDLSCARLGFQAGENYQTEANGTVKITGEIPLTVATGREDTRSLAIPTTPGAGLGFPEGKLGLPTVTVKSFQKTNLIARVVFTIARKDAKLALIRFITADGTEIHATETPGRSRDEPDDTAIIERGFSLRADQPEFFMVITTYSGTETIHAKADLTIGLTAPKP